MKPKTTIIILSALVIALSVALAATYYFKWNTPTDAVSATSTAKAEAFKKKSECSKYKNSLEKEIHTMNQTRPTSYNDLLYLFYSPKLNTCLYVLFESLPATKPVTEGEELKYYDITYRVIDVLTTETIATFTDKDSEEKYKKFIYEYSGGEIKP